MKKRFLIPIGLAFALGAASLQPPAEAKSAATRVIDRTVSCAIGLRAGVRELQVRARSGTRLFEDRSKWKFLAYASVTDPSALQGWGLAGVGAGAPLAPEAGRGDDGTRMGVSTRCAASKTRVPLSASGLFGGPATPLEDRYDCVVPRRVLVRVRAVFRAPTSLRVNRASAQLRAKGIVKEGAIAVRTPTGKPVAFAEVFESGKARLFTARNCVED